MNKILRRMYTENGVDYSVVDADTGKTLTHNLKNIRDTLDLQAENTGRKTALYATPLQELKQSHRSREQLNDWLKNPADIPTDAAAYLGMHTLQQKFSGWELNPTYLSDYKNYVGLADIVATRGNETKLIKINSYRRNAERNAIELGMLKYMYGKMYPQQNVTGTYSLNITQGKNVGRLISEKPVNARELNETFGIQIGPQNWHLPKIPVINLDKQAIEQAKNAPQLPNVFAKASNVDNLIGIHTTLDIETGAGNKPVQIAAYKLGYNPVTRKMEVIDTYIRYYEGAGSPGAESIHGLTPKIRHELRKSTKARYNATYNDIEQESLYNFLAGTKVVGENIIGFDLPNLFTYEQRAELAKLGGIIDTAQLGANFRPRGTNSLDSLFYAAFHKSMSQVGLHHHGAIDDVLATEMIVQHVAGMNSKMGSVLRGLLFSNNAISTQWAEMRHAWTIYGDDGKRIGGYIDMTTGKEYSEEDFLSDKDMAKNILDVTEGGASDIAAIVESMRQQNEESALTRRGLLHTEQAIAQSVASFRDSINTMAGSSKTAIASMAAKANSPEELQEVLDAYGVVGDARSKFEKLAGFIQKNSPGYINRMRITTGHQLGRHGNLLSSDEYEIVSQAIESGDYASLLEAREILRENISADKQAQKERVSEARHNLLAKERFDYRKETAINKALAAGDQYAADRFRDTQYSENYDAISVMKAQIAAEKKALEGPVNTEDAARLRFARRLNTEVLKAEASGKSDLAERLRGLSYKEDYDVISVEKAKAAKEATENMRRLNEELQNTSNISKTLSGAIAQLGKIPYYDYTQWGATLNSEISGVASAARGVIPAPIYRPASRMLASYQNMLTMETDNFKSKKQMLHALGTGVTGLGGTIGLAATGGNPLGAAAGAAIGGTISGTINAATQAHGTATEMSIRTIGETIQSKLNLFGALGEYIRTPFNLLHTTIHGIASIFNRLRGIVSNIAKVFGRLPLDIIGKNIANMMNLGTPWTYLTQAGSIGYRRSRYVDMASGLRGGSINASWNKWAGAQQDLYTRGQLDTDRVVAAAMLGEFSSVYGRGGNTEAEYGGFINRQLNAMQGLDKNSRASKLRLVEKVDENAAQVISRITQMRYVKGYGDLRYEDLSNPKRFGVYARPLSDEERGRSFITATQWQMQKSTFQDTGIRLVNAIWEKFGNKFATQMNTVLDKTVQRIITGDWRGVLNDTIGAAMKGIRNIRNTLKSIDEEWGIGERFTKLVKDTIQKVYNSVSSVIREKGIDVKFGNAVLNMFSSLAKSIVTIWHNVINEVIAASGPIIAFFKDLQIGFDPKILGAELAKGKKGNILKAFSIGLESTTDRTVKNLDDKAWRRTPVTGAAIRSIGGFTSEDTVYTGNDLIKGVDTAVDNAFDTSNGKKVTGVVPLYIGAKQVGRVTGSTKEELRWKLLEWTKFVANLDETQMWQHLMGDTSEAAAMRSLIYDPENITKSLSSKEGLSGLHKKGYDQIAGGAINEGIRINDEMLKATMKGIDSLTESATILIDITSNGKNVAEVQADSSGSVNIVQRSNISNISVRRGLDKQVVGGN